MTRRVEEVARAAAIVDLVEACDPGRRDRFAKERTDKGQAAEVVKKLVDSEGQPSIVRVTNLPRGQYPPPTEDDDSLLDIHV